MSGGDTMVYDHVKNMLSMLVILIIFRLLKQGILSSKIFP